MSPCVIKHDAWRSWSLYKIWIWWQTEAGRLISHCLMPVSEPIRKSPIILKYLTSILFHVPRPYTLQQVRPH